MTIATQPAEAAADDLLGCWRRDRSFGLGPFGEKWWMASLKKNKITPTSIDVEIPVIATGSQIIEILEIRPNGEALYREYFVSPDGDLVRTHWVSQYETIWSTSVGTLRGMLKRMKMTKVQPAQRKLHTAEIIRFPASRIVRRIEHGKPVTERKSGSSAA